MQAQENAPINISGQITTTLSGFMTQVYMWMTGGVFLTAIIAMSMTYVVNSSFFWFYTNDWFFPLMFVLELVIVIALAGFIDKMNTVLAAILFMVYAVINGLFFGAIMPFYTESSVALAFAATAGTFLLMTVYGAVTKADLTRFGSLAIMGLIGLILGSVLNIFLASDGLSWVLTYLGIGIFIVLIAYDTQKLKAYAAMAEANPGSYSKYAIRGALTLYLDFINLFIRLLQVFGRRK